ncbi:MAG: serine/threonine-protein kinase [Candidatus Obscuribacter sp.]|nr:serine/threonine-protein kinase [Candidatus Obscuribacter sp.]
MESEEQLHSQFASPLKVKTRLVEMPEELNVQPAPEAESGLSVSTGPSLNRLPDEPQIKTEEEKEEELPVLKQTLAFMLALVITIPLTVKAIPPAMLICGFICVFQYLQHSWFKSLEHKSLRLFGMPLTMMNGSSFSPFLTYPILAGSLAWYLWTGYQIAAAGAVISLLATGVLIYKYANWLIVSPALTAELMEKADGKETPLNAFTTYVVTYLSSGLTLAALFSIHQPGLAALTLVLAMLAYSLLTAQTERCMNRGEILGRALKKTAKEKPRTIAYRPLAGVEKWFRSRFTSEGRASHWKLILLLVVTLTLIFLDPGKQMSDLIVALTSGGAAPQGDGTAAGAVSTAGSIDWKHLFVLSFSLTFVGTVLTYLTMLLRFPRALLSSSQGLAYRFGKWSGKRSEFLPWNQITHIGIEKKKGSTSHKDDNLVLKTGKKNLSLKLSGFETADDREALLAEIEKYAPRVPRDPEVAEYLSKPPDRSYTELWLQALSAPPKRERLKPLSKDALLQNGRFQVLKELGSGGQGFAYLAVDQDGRHVVLKEFVLPIYVDIQARKKALERFENEARLLSKLDHPQVVKLQHFFVEDHRAYLVLEHIDGKNLRQLVSERGAFSQTEAQDLALKMCEILKYLHGLTPPLVHRDFTPDNLILDNQGNLKLIDFNVAQEMQEATTGTVVGKQSYLPPEQFRGQACPASDLYAMGATIFFILTGKEPTPISTIKLQEEAAEGQNFQELFCALLKQLTDLEPGKRPTSEAVSELLAEGRTRESFATDLS